MNIVFADKNGHWITIPGTKPCMHFRGTFHLSHMSSGWIICRQFVQNILGLVCCHRRIAMKEVEIDTTLWRFLSCHVLKIIWHYCCVWLKRMMLCKIQTKSGFCLHRMETWKPSLNSDNLSMFVLASPQFSRRVFSWSEGGHHSLAMNDAKNESASKWMSKYSQGNRHIQMRHVVPLTCLLWCL